MFLDGWTEQEDVTGVSRVLNVTDDSGFLAIVVPSAYEGFVSRNWKLDQLFQHFHSQMRRRALLIWGTGAEDDWRVEVRTDRSDVEGFREISGPIRVTGGAVLVTNYESLTMAAQCADSALPEPFERDQVVPLIDGDYCCRIIQMFDPTEEEPTMQCERPDFVVEFTRPAVLPPEWSEVPWFKL
jgi:hypothetical protein